MIRFEHYFNKSVSIALTCTIGLVVAYFLYELASYLLIDYPFNQYEPEVIMDSWGLAHGQDLYPARSIGPIAGLYAPLYHIVVAFFFQFLPETLLTARLVSISSLFVGMYFIKKTTSELPFPALLAFLGILIWHPIIAEFDFHAKPDSFSVLLGMASVYFLIKSETISWRAILVSALFSALAISTKQSMLFVPVGIGLALLISRNYKAVFNFSFSFLLITAGLWSVFTYTLGPDLWYYVFVQPGSFQMRWGSIFINFWSIQSNLPWLILLGLIPVFIKQHSLPKPFLLLLCVSLFALPASVLTASKGGGLTNAYQPFFYFLTWTLLSAVAYQWKKGLNLEDWVLKNKIWAKALLILIIWFTLRPNIPSIITSVNHRLNVHASYEKLAETLRENQGIVYVPMDNYLSLKAGKPLRWSYKWQVETRLSAPNNPPQNHTSIALASDMVVTILNYDWTSDTKLESDLIKHGYKQLEVYKMDLFREYRLWKKPNPTEMDKMRD